MGGASRLNRMDAVRERTSKVPIITEGSQNGDLRFSEAKANPAIAATCVNLTKNLVGSGIFSLPSALQRGSVIPGVGIMCFVGAVQGGSFILIAALCQKLGTRTYRGAWSAAFGQRSGCIVDLCIAINSFFACVAYMILVADFLQNAMEGLFGWHDVPRRAVIWSATLAITLPLSHARNLAPLRYTSMMGLGIIALVYVYQISCFAIADVEVAKLNIHSNLVRLDLGIFSTLALSTGAFQAHYNSPKIFLELGRNLKAHCCTVAVSFGTAFLIYVSFAIAGLGLFGDQVLGNVLVNYEGNTTVLMAWLGMAFSIVFTYPLVFTTGRDSLIALSAPLQRSVKVYPAVSHIAITSSLVSLISLVACSVSDVSIVTGFLGATIGACLAWIFPASIYLKVTLGGPSKDALELMLPLLAQKPSLPHSKIQTQPPSQIMICCAFGMIMVGFLSMGVGLSKTFGIL